MPQIDSLLNAFISIQDKPYALGIFAICFFMIVMGWIFWVLLKIIEAVKK